MWKMLFIVSKQSKKRPLPYLKSTPSNSSNCVAEEKQPWISIKQTHYKADTSIRRMVWRHLSKADTFLQIFQTVKFHAKRNRFKFRSKNASLNFSQSEIWKTFCHIWNQILRICQNANYVFLALNWKNLLSCKMTDLEPMKKLGFMLKKSWIWSKRCLIWVFLGCNL